MFIKPREGLTIIDPELRDVIPPEGREVTESPYWTLRLRDKDVVLAEAPKEKKAPAKPAPSEEK